MSKVHLNGVSFHVKGKTKDFKKNLEYNIWKEAFFQYLVDHSVVNSHTGMFDSYFSFEDKNRLISHIEGRIFRDYRRNNYDFMLHSANHYRKERRLRKNNRKKRREKMPDWLRHTEHHLRRFVIKTLAGIRSFLKGVIQYLDT